MFDISLGQQVINFLIIVGIAAAAWRFLKAWDERITEIDERYQAQMDLLREINEQVSEINYKLGERE